MEGGFIPVATGSITRLGIEIGVCLKNFKGSCVKCKRAITVQGEMKPCGQCMFCRVNQQRNWQGRILLEMSTTTSQCWFLTLSIENAHIPTICTAEGEYVQTVHKPQLKAYLARATQNAGPFRYYAVAEYGSDTMRAHYHMAIFPRNDAQIDIITDQWGLGNVETTPLGIERAAYLVGYALKKLTNPKDERLRSGQSPEWRESSRAPPLGYAAALAIADRYREGHGAKILAERGDVERTFRIARKVLPLAPQLLTVIRRQLGIPLLHRERLDHPGYQEWHGLQESAEWEPEIANAEEIAFKAKKKANKLRGRAI